jgi:hypothetical protein
MRNHSLFRILPVLALLASTALGCKYVSSAVQHFGDGTPTPETQYTAAAVTAATPEDVSDPTRTPGAPSALVKATPAAPGEGSGLTVYLAQDENGAVPADTFGQGDPVYVYGTLTLPEGANLRTAWTAVQAEGNEPNTLIYEYEDKAYQPGAFWFRLEWPRPWALGRYRVDVYMNGEIVQSLDYTVVNTNTAGATMDTPSLSTDQEGAQVVTSFSAADTFYVHFNLTAPDPDTPVRAVWSARSVEGLSPNSYINEFLALMNSGPNWLSIAQAQPWAVGDYGLDLYVNGELAQSLTFSVASTNPDGVALADAYTARDEAGSDTTEAFAPADAIYVHFSLADVPDDTRVTASLAAVDANGYNTYLDKFQDVFSSGDYYIYFTPETTWAPGKYIIYLYIDGDLDRQIELTVQ